MNRPHGEYSADQRRLTSAPSVIDAVGRHVTDLTLIATQDTPEWLRPLGIPPGWHIAHVDTKAPQPLRIAVCGERAEGGWDGCETLSIFQFTGIPPDGVVAESNDCTLRGLEAQGITTYPLSALSIPGVCAVRSSGYFTAAGRRLWAQYSTYIAASHSPGEGRLIAECIFVDADARARLRDDITELSDGVYAAFLAAIDTVVDADPTTPLPTMEVHHDGA